MVASTSHGIFFEAKKSDRSVTATATYFFCNPSSMLDFSLPYLLHCKNKFYHHHTVFVYSEARSTPFFSLIQLYFHGHRRVTVFYISYYQTRPQDYVDCFNLYREYASRRKKKKLWVPSTTLRVCIDLSRRQETHHTKTFNYWDRRQLIGLSAMLSEQENIRLSTVK